MIKEFKSDLFAVQANSGDVDLYNRVLRKIANWNVSESSEDRKVVAELFYSTLAAIQSTENDGMIETFYGDTIDAFKNISLIAKTGKDSACLVLIDFLNDLYQRRDKLSTKIKITQDELLVLLSDLGPVKYIFKITDSEGYRFFPVNKVLGNIILDPSFINTKIEPYHVNIIQLAVEMYKVTSAGIDDQFEKLINECNLKFITYLDGTSSRIDTIDMCNFRNNQVMVFYDINAQKVLVRHEDKAYFQGIIDDSKIQSEYNSLGKEIGYFVELLVNGTAIDYSEAIKNSPKEFLRLLYEKKCKNVLIEKMILRTADGNLEPLNPFCVNDRWIVKGKNEGREGKICLPNEIIDSVEEGRLQLFSDCENHSVLDQVSVGLCMSLLENRNILIDDMFKGMENNDWIQNIVINNWISNAGDIIDAIEFALMKYANDLDYCSKDDTIRKLEFEKGHIRDCLPYAFELREIYRLLDMPLAPSIFLGTITEEDEDLFYVDFSPMANKSVAKNNCKDITFISSTDVTLLDETRFKEFYIDGTDRYFILKDGQWYSSLDFQNVYKLIVDVELKNARMLDYSINTVLHENAYNKIKYAMSLHIRALSDISVKKIEIESLFKIRLANNLLLNRITVAKWNSYFNLINKQQILSFVGIEHDKYFSKKEDGTIVVPKDRIQEDAVLRSVYESYIRANATRDLAWWFSENYLTKENDVYFLNGTQVDKVRFLFDNTEHGTATIRTIAANLGKIDEWVEFEKVRTGQPETSLRDCIRKQIDKCKQFRCDESRISLAEIMAKNHIMIESCSFYGTREGDDLIKSFLLSCGIEEKDIFVYHAKDIVKKAEIVKEDCEKLGVTYNDKTYIVIREYNMPKKYLLPKGVVGKANNVVTLLVKKDEI